MSKLTNTDSNSLETLSEKPPTDGPGEASLLKIPEWTGGYMYVPNVATELEVKTLMSTTSCQSLELTAALLPGESTSSICSPTQEVGKFCVQNVMTRKQEEKMSNDVKQKGIKFDDEKPSVAYIPVEGIFEEGRAFKAGEKKYGPWNYKNGMAITRPLAGAIRHIFQFLAGEDIDKETGAHHLGCARANLSMALYILANSPEFDDRFKK